MIDLPRTLTDVVLLDNYSWRLNGNKSAINTLLPNAKVHVFEYDREGGIPEGLTEVVDSLTSWAMVANAFVFLDEPSLYKYVTVVQKPELTIVCSCMPHDNLLAAKYQIEESGSDSGYLRGTSFESDWSAKGVEEEQTSKQYQRALQHMRAA